jgi:hypothetical protein
MEHKTCTRPGLWSFMPGLLVGVVVGSFSVAFTLPIVTEWIERPREARQDVNVGVRTAEVASQASTGR